MTWSDREEQRRDGHQDEDEAGGNQEQTEFVLHVTL
jgi:hypothetical protein